MDDQHQMKQLENAIATIWALERRKRMGQMNGEAEAALREAESVVGAVSGRKLLQAWRLWVERGSRVRDPTGGYVRNTGELPPEATSIRQFVRPKQSFKSSKPDREQEGR